MSTVGVVPYLRRLRREFGARQPSPGSGAGGSGSGPSVKLAISLHAATQPLRKRQWQRHCEEIVPHPFVWFRPECFACSVSPHAA